MTRTAPDAPTAREAPRRDPARYSRRRAATLIGVHVLIAAHVLHWRLAGRTLAPLELNEVMYTLELGVVTAGFLLMATAALSAALFGRFFCSWACHILALQDFSSWLLARAGIRARPVRSRVLRAAPFALMFYMFLWPQVRRLLAHEALPRLHLADADAPWASFRTDDFWRNLPGPWIAGLTFLVCGFLIVYLLGSRAFCRAGCPYGAVFALADRLAPVRIALRGDCTHCGRCTAVCQSGVVVHAEVQRFGRIVDPGCLKDLDCVAVCPAGALRVGLARPAGWLSLARAGVRRGFGWKGGEDVLAGAVMLGTILVARGLYDSLPLLLSVGLGAAAAALAVTTVRLLRAREFSLRHLVLRRRARFTAAGHAFLASAAALGALWLHSAFVRWHETHGLRAFEGVRAALASGERERGAGALQSALLHLEACEQWGLFHSLDHDRRLASLYTLSGQPVAALRHLRRIIAAAPAEHEARLRLAFALIACSQWDDAEGALRALGALPDLAPEIRQGLTTAQERLRQARASSAGAHARGR